MDARRQAHLAAVQAGTARTARAGHAPSPSSQLPWAPPCSGTEGRTAPCPCHVPTRQARGAHRLSAHSAACAAGRRRRRHTPRRGLRRRRARNAQPRGSQQHPPTQRRAAAARTRPTPSRTAAHRRRTPSRTRGRREGTAPRAPAQASAGDPTRLRGAAISPAAPAVPPEPRRCTQRRGGAAAAAALRGSRSTLPPPLRRSSPPRRRTLRCRARSRVCRCGGRHRSGCRGRQPCGGRGQARSAAAERRRPTAGCGRETLRGSSPGPCRGRQLPRPRPPAQTRPQGRRPADAGRIRQSPRSLPRVSGQRPGCRALQRQGRGRRTERAAAAAAARAVCVPCAWSSRLCRTACGHSTPRLASCGGKNETLKLSPGQA
eukprot:Rhum_TRINITY_DN12634_c0_g1::Rhum_TRINITY_DN12634_c0_g1_i1::g.53344::m.53344